MAKTVVGLFNDSIDVGQVIHELNTIGFSNKDISVISNEPNDYTEHSDRNRAVSDTEADTGAGIGAATGALAGGAAGILASLGLLAIPGIGPLLAAGPIVAALTGAGVGAAAGGLLGGLIGLGIPEDDAKKYEEAVNRGGTLVSVSADDSQAERVAEIMSSHNAADIDKLSTSWRNDTSTAGTAPSYSGRGRDVPARGQVDDNVTADDLAVSEDAGSVQQPTDLSRPRRSNTARIYNPL